MENYFTFIKRARLLKKINIMQIKVIKFINLDT